MYVRLYVKASWICLITVLAVSACTPAAPAVTSTPVLPTATSTTAVTPSITAPAQQGSAAITAGNAAALVSRSLDLPEIPEHLLWPAAAVNGLPNADLFAQAGATLYPVLLDPPSLGEVVNLPLNGGRIFDIAPDASSIAVQDSNGLALYSLTGALLHVLDELQPYGAKYSLDGQRIAVTAADQWAVSIYDTASGQRLQWLTGFETAAPIYSAAVSPDGKTVIWYARATLQFQDAASGDMGRDWHFEDFIATLAFDPRSQLLAVAVAGRLEIFGLPDGDSIARITLSKPVRSLAFSPDGSLLAAAYGDTVQVWNSADWTPVTALLGHQAAVMLAEFSPDGQSLVSVDEQKHMLIRMVP